MLFGYEDFKCIKALEAEMQKTIAVGLKEFLKRFFLFFDICIKCSYFKMFCSACQWASKQ